MNATTHFHSAPRQNPIRAEGILTHAAPQTSLVSPGHRFLYSKDVTPETTVGLLTLQA